jgi:hypothetical protein
MKQYKIVLPGLIRWMGNWGFYSIKIAIVEDYSIKLIK